MIVVKMVTDMYENPVRGVEMVHSTDKNTSRYFTSSKNLSVSKALREVL